MTDVANLVFDGADGIVLDEDLMDGIFTKEATSKIHSYNEHVSIYCNYINLNSVLHGPFISRALLPGVIASADILMFLSYIIGSKTFGANKERYE